MNEDRWDIISNILEPVYENGSFGFRELVKEMNLSTERLKEYINFLSGKQYLELKNENGKKSVSITEKGRVFFRIVNLRKKPEEKSELAKS